jgi:ribosomal protein S18 acetylase RimI-like enzyme
MDRASPERVVIRRVRRDEVAEVRELRLSALRGAPEAFARSYEEEAGQPPAFWEDRTQAAAEGDDVAAFVAVAGGRHVATATCLVGGAPGRAVLVGMWVEPPWRRRGIGSRLIAAACGWACTRGAPAVDLVVHLINEDARLLYERAGFVPLGEPETGEGGKLELRMSLTCTAGRGAPLD